MTTFYAKTHGRIWEAMEDRDGPCENPPHAASTYAELHCPQVGAVVEVTSEHHDIQLWQVVSVEGAEVLGVSWIGSRVEQP